MIWILLYLFISIVIGIVSYYETKAEYPKVSPFSNFIASQIFGIMWPVWVIVRLWEKL